MRIKYLNIDWILFGSLMGLAVIGLLALSMSVDQVHPELWQHQTGFVIAGLLGFTLFCFVPLKVIKVAAWPVYGIALLLIILVWRIGWRVDLGFLQVQSAEIMLWAIIFVLASWFSNSKAHGWMGMLIPILLFAAPMVVIFNQFGLVDLSALILIASIMAIAAAQWRLLLISVANLILFLSLYWHFGHEYMRNRMPTWLGEQFSPMDGYSVLQSTGEFGTLIMGLSVLFVALLIWRMIVIAHGARDRFAFMLCVGIASMISLYLILNIALLTDAFDVVKILAPFVRYDGLDLTGLTAVMGLVMRIAIESNASNSQLTGSKKIRLL